MASLILCVVSSSSPRKEERHRKTERRSEKTPFDSARHRQSSSQSRLFLFLRVLRSSVFTHGGLPPRGPWGYRPYPLYKRKQVFCPSPPFHHRSRVQDSSCPWIWRLTNRDLSTRAVSSKMIARWKAMVKPTLSWSRFYVFEKLGYFSEETHVLVLSVHER